MNAAGTSGQSGIAHPDIVTGSPDVVISIDMFRTRADRLTQAQDLAGLDTSADNIGIIGWLNNNSLLIVSGNGQTEIANAVTPGTWNNFALDFNFQTHTFDAYLNGNLEGSNLPFAAGATSTAFFGGELAIENPGLDHLFFDNYLVETSPEPASGLLCVLPIAALLVRRRLASRASHS